MQSIYRFIDNHKTLRRLVRLARLIYPPEYQRVARKYAARIRGIQKVMASIGGDYSIRITPREVLLDYASCTFGWNPRDPSSLLGAPLRKDGFESTETAIIKEFLAPGAHFFDIGANFGWYTIIMGRSFPGISVHAFEPNPLAFTELLENIGRNNLDRLVVANNIGLGDKRKKMQLFVPRRLGSAFGSLKAIRKYDQDMDVVDVKIGLLDEYCRSKRVSRIDFIKMDVEGAELLVLKGGLKSIRRFKPVLLLETQKYLTKEFGYHPDEVFDLLRETHHAYAVCDHKIFPIGTYADAKDRSYNFLFVPKDKKLLVKVRAISRSLRKRQRDR